MPVRGDLPEVSPWLAFLSRDELQQFATELMSTVQAADSIDDSAPIVQVIESWRHTAEIIADPELAALLTADTDDDLGSIPEPEAT